MKKTFTQSFPGAGTVEMEVYWNEKDYRGTKYVEVKQAGSRQKGTQMTWVDGQGWTKHGGMPYAQKVAELLGFN